jgi:DNA repair exonuclease SbcCD ATPase subunit
MIIRRMKASFGKLNNAEIKLDGGLNIVNEPNEAGKSTWCAFIRIMLYGLNTSERDRAGFLSDKTRYRPWGTYPMEGLMDIVWKGKEITLIRKSKGSNLLGVCEAVYTGTGEPCPELSVKSPGDILIGVPEQVFRRSAFIRRPAMALDKDAELEKRISALVASGEEDSSYTEANERLGKWLRKRNRKPSGTLYQAENRRRDLLSALDRLDAENDRLARLRDEKERLSALQAEMKEELRMHQKLESDAIRSRLEEQRKEEDALAAEIKSLTEALSPSGRLINKEDITLVQKTAEELSESDEITEKAGNEADEAYEKLQQVKKVNTQSGGRKSKFAAYLAFLGVFLVAFNMLSTVKYLWMFGAGLILAAILVLVFDLKRTEKSAAERNAELKTLEYEYNDAQRRYRSHESANGELRRRAKAYLSRLDPGAPLESVQAVIRNAETGLIKLEQLKLRYEAAKKNADELEKICPDGGRESINVKVRYTKEEAESGLLKIEKNLQEVSQELAMAIGETRHLGDPLVLSTEVNRLDNDIERLGLECEALDLAVQTLSEANAELQSRFSPLVSERAGIFMRYMTDGRYTGVVFDRNMNFKAQTESELVHREIGYLSDGTADQLYLSARLAVSLLVLPGDELCPIILDDALANFDDKRAKRALELLRELSKERQIIFFTCRDREASFIS